MILLIPALSIAVIATFVSATSVSAESKYERCMSRCQLATSQCNKRCIKR